MSVSIRLQIRTVYNDLSPKKQAIANYILESSSKVSHNSISGLASELDIADSTFFQFARKLDYNGFEDLKMAMLIQGNDLSAVSIYENIQRTDTELTMARKVFESNISTLDDTKKLLQQKDLKKTTTIINKSKRIYFFDANGSEIVVTDAYHKFLHSPIATSRSTGYHIQLMEASLLTEKDHAVLIPYTRQSKETIHIAKTVRKAGVKTIVITNQANSSLAKLGDVVFISISEETESRPEALASHISQLSISDSLYVILAFYNEKESRRSIAKVRYTISEIKEQHRNRKSEKSIKQKKPLPDIWQWLFWFCKGDTEHQQSVGQDVCHRIFGEGCIGIIRVACQMQ